MDKLKTCFTCKRTLPLTEFFRASANKDGYQGNCKECKRVYKRKWKRENPEHLRDYNKKYREEHKKEIQLNMKKYLSTEKGKACRFRSNHGRRAGHDSLNTLTDAEWRIIKDFQDDKCWMCGEEMNDIYMDDNEATREHVIPVRDGGNNVYGNIVALCRSCNCKQMPVFEIAGVPDYITAFMAIT